MTLKTKYQPQVHPKCGKTMTEQSHKKSCDINSIMAKYVKTGLVDHINRHQPKFGDVTGADFKAAQDLVAEAKSEFYELPAAVREQFTDVSEYLDLVTSDEGVETLRGMLTEDEEPVEEESPPENIVLAGDSDGEAGEAAVT